MHEFCGFHWFRCLLQCLLLPVLLQHCVMIAIINMTINAGVFCDNCFCLNCCNTVDTALLVEQSKQNIIKARPAAFQPKVSAIHLVYVRHSQALCSLSL